MMETEEGLPLSVSFSVVYESDGPWFDAVVKAVPDITCSIKDKGWFFDLPRIGAEDQ